MIRNNSIHVASALLSLLGAAAVAQAFTGPALLGWGMSTANYLAGIYLKKSGLQCERDVQRYSVFTVIRLLTFLTVVFIILAFLRQGQMPFVYALLISYAVFMTADLIWILNFREGAHGRRI